MFTFVPPIYFSPPTDLSILHTSHFYLAYILLNLSKSIHFQKVDFFNFIHLPFSNICQPLSPDSQRCVNYLTFSFKDIFIFHPKMEWYYLVLPNPLHYGHWATIILLLFNYSYVGYSMVMQHSWTWNDLPKFFFRQNEIFSYLHSYEVLSTKKT